LRLGFAPLELVGEILRGYREMLLCWVPLGDLANGELLGFAVFFEN
jgi:hypothetical protein